MVSATYYTYSVQVLWEIEKEFLFLPIYTFTSLNYFIIYSSLSWESIATEWLFPSCREQTEFIG
jgi:hypothetical protein